MDSVTQAALGAAIGEMVLGKKIGYKGAVVGAVIATIPDLDILLYPFLTPLQSLSVHRGFSHSVVFSIIGTILITLLLMKIKWTKEINYLKLGSFTWLCLITHMLLDAFTSYGTQLFLPFSDHRVSLDSINIIDPPYTVILLIGIVLSTVIYRKSVDRSRYSKIALILSCFYLTYTLMIKDVVNKQFSDDLIEQDINHVKFISIPVGVGGINWYGVAKSDEGIYIGKTKVNSSDKIEFHFFKDNSQLLDGLDPYLVDRLIWFSKDFYTVAEHNGKIRLYNLQCDMQGVRTYGDYRAPTAFYFEIDVKENGKYKLTSGMHPAQ